MKKVFRFVLPMIVTLAIVVFSSQTCLAQCSVTLPQDVFAVDSQSQAQNPDGRSWECAFPTIQEAIDEASAGAQIWVAASTTPYTPPNASGFVIPEGVGVYGGFTGNETQLTQADPYANLTILDGDNIDGNGLVADHVVKVEDTQDIRTWLDGFIIRNGDADGSNDEMRGGGLLVLVTEIGTTSLTVTRCRFYDNSASRGGAVALIKSSPFAQAELIVAFTNCEFIDNSADGNGGAIFVQENVTATITNSLFVGNSADGDGAAISKTNARIINCEFRGNRTPTAGEQPVPRH